MTPSHPATPYVVCIGASAGGLEALLVVLFHLRPTGRMAYVIAQHMASGGHSTLMATLLSRNSRLPVLEAAANAPLLPDHVYVIPSGQDGVIQGGSIRLVSPARENLSTPSVNVLFSSAAEDAGRHAIGVVLSGTGSDGTAGCRAIKARGGKTFAQAPDAATYDGMPSSAIEAGVIDHVCRETELFETLIAALPGVSAPGHAAQTRPPQAPMTLEPTPSGDSQYLSRLVRLIEEATGIDFAGYKEETLLRRLERRMSNLGIASLREYLQRASRDAGELQTIQQLFLVSLSSFFRDAESFEVLARELRTLLSAGSNEQRIRCWVPGCATGEEVYTLAIILAEVLGERLLQHDIVITGTDLNPDALQTAAAGLYGAAAFKEMEPLLRQRYFAAEGTQWLIGDRIRSMCRFEQRDVIATRPAESQDLISCRNLLIYLKGDLQDRLMRKFHQSLHPHGLLFLSQSENLGPLGGTLFKGIDTAHRLYRRR